MTVSCFIEAGTVCGLCGIPMQDQDDKPVVVDLHPLGEGAYHEDCLGPEVMTEIRINQKEMTR